MYKGTGDIYVLLRICSLIKNTYMVYKLPEACQSQAAEIRDALNGQKI